ncbi:hypothetical protein DACRYDRAFT_46329 [Dacryopinax primogenitus]|uniref:Translocation protein sec66 n=1 Tax=Dacryopinax primogenitus (strain DJM 731) TaxID=1858805 RepID=M5GGF7_DACPD|nr:uncharacterized protein DACRYDRAFT_46329 [Dacryopinax primogenitus]EJU05408.1 hypothetical protein DACRYDRAFT_46329 [Dacryopinax primogenitus]
MASIYVPLIYVGVLVLGMLIFSHFYRKRRAPKYEPWFLTHPERDVYTSLLSQDPPPHDALLKAALLQRAATDVRRLMRLTEDKQALSQLLQKGSINDDLWASFQQAEREMQAEMVEVVREAATFKEGWDKTIFASANEIVLNGRHKEHYTKVQKLHEASSMYPRLLLSDRGTDQVSSGSGCPAKRLYRVNEV